MGRIDRRFPYLPAGGGAAYSLIGEVITLKVSSSETCDTFSVTELISRPGGGPPLHTHPAAGVFIVQDGEFEFTGLERGEPYTIRATLGDIVYIPGGAPHTYTTVSPMPSRAVGVLAPGGEMERFFAEVGTLVTDRNAATARSQNGTGSTSSDPMRRRRRKWLSRYEARDRQPDQVR